MKNFKILISGILLLFTVFASGATAYLEIKDILPGKEILMETLLKYYKRLVHAIKKEDKKHDGILIDLLSIGLECLIPGFKSYKSNQIYDLKNHLYNDLSLVNKNYEDIKHEIDLYNIQLSLYNSALESLKAQETKSLNGEITEEAYRESEMELHRQYLALKSQHTKIMTIKNDTLHHAKLYTQDYFYAEDINNALESK